EVESVASGALERREGRMPVDPIHPRDTVASDVADLLLHHQQTEFRFGDPTLIETIGSSHSLERPLSRLAWRHAAQCRRLRPIDILVAPVGNQLMSLEDGRCG